MGGVFILFLPGSARVSRAGFRVSRKRTFRPAFIFLRPHPWIILVLLGRPRIPGIPQNVLKFLNKVPVRPDVAIEPFLFPYAASFAFRFIYCVRRLGLNPM